MELKKLPYVSYHTDAPIIAQAPFVNQLPRDHIPAVAARLLGANTLLPITKNILLANINSFMFEKNKKDNLNAVMDAIISNPESFDTFRYLIGVFERYIDYGDIIPEYYHTSSHEFLISMMHACAELCARFHQAAEKTELKKAAKSYFLHCAAFEHLLAEVKTNSYLFAMDSEKFSPDRLKDISLIVRAGSDEDFERTLVDALLNNFGVGPVNTNAAGRFFDIGIG